MEMISILAVSVFFIAVFCAFAVFAIALMGIGIVWANNAIVSLLS